MTVTETVQKSKWKIIIALFLIIAGVTWFVTRPTYDDVYTAKPIKGNTDAMVRIVEFSDFQCPACGAAAPTVKKIMEVYGDRVSLEYKHFPLTSIHAFAFNAAEASECANDQGKFWEMHDIMFEKQDELSISSLKDYAEQIGLDTEKFNNCLDSNAKAKYVTADFNEGIGKGVDSTPSFFVNGKKIESWKYEIFAAALDAALAEAGAAESVEETETTDSVNPSEEATETVNEEETAGAEEAIAE
ncbi:DsbA family protein [Candidatus Woesearchaeota archaeon]|nr:DsbA family protein [Candidatus Woesearchaeota archaeon]